ncbi:MAG: glycosyltransferase [Saprospiraceae bacterium]|nr:glycosyltransferase [Saprospiraceae bacterium]
MKLAVIIVNYNVRHFLEQALLSVRKAAEGLSVETWVVDNNSVDDSVAMVQQKFPEVMLIANRENVGFSTANNQAIRLSTAEYVLLLNPDTVVQADTFQKTLDFMDSRPDIGGLGVRTIDGSGTFLPESKRGFPSPWVAFCKAFGLSALFPKSPLFNRYYLGYLSEFESHEIDVLVGSFMLMRRSILDKIGLLDEAFFMYGEDIDLSYRIVKGGFKNYYFADTTIIHYKGESTKKGSLNYVRVFYGAMIIFAKKHFQGQEAASFITLMQAAVWFRAAVTVVTALLKKIYLPVVDALLIFTGLFFLKTFWSNYYFDNQNHIKSVFLYVNAPIYISLWLLTIYMSGGYDLPVSLRRVLRGVFVGTFAAAAVYGFLDMPFRSSRMLIVLGALWVAMALVGLRFLLHFLKNRNFKLGTEGVQNLVIVGSKTEAERVLTLLNQANVTKNFIGIVNPDATNDHDNFLGSLRQLSEIVRIYRVEEVIFCGRDVPANDIMALMSELGAGIDLRIVPEESQSIIGSSDKNTKGELYTIDIRFNIAQPIHRRNKRLFDVVLSAAFLCIFPIFIFFIKNKKTFLTNAWSILIGNKTWVAYASQATNDKSSFENLPRLKQGIFSPLHAANLSEPNAPTIHRLNFLYAKDYDVWRDAEIVWKGL